MKPITPQLKDSLLKYLCDRFDTDQLQGFDFSDAMQALGIDRQTLHVLLRGFLADGLLRHLSIGNAYGHLCLAPKIYDILAEGGYSAKSLEVKLKREVLQAQIAALQEQTRILQELAEEVRKSNPSLMEKILGVAGNMSSVVSAFLSV